jgi:hypothetical protein
LTFLLPISAIAQDADTVKSYRPTGIRVGTDMLLLGKSFYKEKFYGWEVSGDIDFYKYLLVVEIGSSGRELNPKGDGFYSNNGNYFRIGSDLNFLQGDPSGNILFFGFRYGRSFFNESLVISSTDPLWGDRLFNVESNGVRGRWLELTTGMRVSVFKYFMLGYTARFKFAPKTTGEGELISYEIPGYGIKDLNIYWGFNYQLLFKIPLKAEVKPRE